MCTNITLKSAEDKFLMARTMDFSFELEPEMAVFPRNMKLEFDVATALETHYAFMGLAKDVGSYYIADGINEHGLTAAALYFVGYAHFKEKSDDLENMIAPHELVMWMLATCKTVDDVIEQFNKINVVNEVIGFIGIVPPLHWTFLDTSGKSIVVEIMSDGIHIESNKLGVLTNSPDYQWHLTNVRNYVGLDPNPNEGRTMYGDDFKAFGGSGSFGLPGDYTPPSRFVRALYNKAAVTKAQNSDELVLNAMHILNSVDLPKGSVITERHTIDYTQYTSYMLNNDRKYYYRMHDSLNIVELKLEDYDLEANQIIIIN